MERSFLGIGMREFFVILLLLLTGLLPLGLFYFMGAENSNKVVPKEQQYKMPEKEAVFAEQSTFRSNLL